MDGQDITKYSERQLTGYRRDDIGFVFQFYNLIPNLTALENVEMALQICRNPLDARAVLRLQADVALQRPDAATNCFVRQIFPLSIGIHKEIYSKQTGL